MSLLAGPAFALLRAYAKIAPTERGGFRLARTARRLLPRDQWRGVFNTGRGYSLELDLSTYPDVCMAFGIYERDTDRLLAKLIRPGSHVLDGGANIGYFTCRAAQLAGERGRVHAFEPDARNRERLVANLARNRFTDRVMVHPLALSDTAGRLTFYRPAAASTHNHGETGRFPLKNGESESYDVDAVAAPDRVDSVPDVIKLDLEGGELHALEGMRPWLAADRPPAIVMEHNPAASSRAAHRGGDAWRLANAQRDGWTCHLVKSWVTGHLKKLSTPDDLDEVDWQCNVLLRRKPD